MTELGTIYKTGYIDLITGEYFVQYESPFLVAFSYVLIIGFSLFAFKFFYKIWK
jgi:hypothetical protein